MFNWNISLWSGVKKETSFHERVVDYLWKLEDLTIDFGTSVKQIYVTYMIESLTVYNSCAFHHYEICLSNISQFDG